jgi:hypothetical protein
VRKLFLDDCRRAPDFTWDTVRSYKEFIAYIKFHGVTDVISFDHDLGDEHYEVVKWDGNLMEGVKEIPYDKYKEKTGYDCAKWLVENNLLPKEYYVHSMNVVGAMNIKFIMEAAYKRL